MKMKFSLSLLSLLFTSSAFSQAYSPSAVVMDPGAYKVHNELTYFNTTGLYDIEGQAVEYEEGQAFQLMDVDIIGSYAYGRQLELKAGTRYRQIMDETEAISNSNAGLESIMAGVKYQFQTAGKLKIAGDFEYRSTLYTNEEFQSGTTTAEDELILGDSGAETTFGLHLSYLRNPSNTLNAFGAYRIPGNNLSAELVYDVHSAWDNKSWAFILGVKGIISMGLDDYATDQSGRPVQAVPKSSNQFYSINRSYNKPYAGINLKSGNWTFGGQFAQVMSGTYTDQGWEMLGSITWQSKGQTKEQRKLESFKEYDIEASVIKVSPRGKFVKLDKGLAQDIEKGMRMDIFQTDFFGKNELIATGYVYELGADWAILKLTKKYRKISVKVGFTARGN